MDALFPGPQEQVLLLDEGVELGVASDDGGRAVDEEPFSDKGGLLEFTAMTTLVVAGELLPACDPTAV